MPRSAGSSPLGVPGDDAVDDVCILAEMYIQHYWREVEDFKLPDDVADDINDNAKTYDENVEQARASHPENETLENDDLQILEDFMKQHMAGGKSDD